MENGALVGKSIDLGAAGRSQRQQISPRLTSRLAAESGWARCGKFINSPTLIKSKKPGTNWEASFSFILIPGIC